MPEMEKPTVIKREGKERRSDEVNQCLQLLGDLENVLSESKPATFRTGVNR